MSKRVNLTDLEIKVLLSLMDGCSEPKAWPEHAMFSTAAFANLRRKLQPKRIAA